MRWKVYWVFGDSPTSEYDCESSRTNPETLDRPEAVVHSMKNPISFLDINSGYSHDNVKSVLPERVAWKFQKSSVKLTPEMNNKKTIHKIYRSNKI